MINKLTGIRVLFLYGCFFAPALAISQDNNDSTNQFLFSGTITATSNGISPIPAFSLDKPAVLAYLSLHKKRFSYEPWIAFSSKGVPWFFNNCFRYKFVDRSKFTLRGGVIWGLGYSYPNVDRNGTPKTVAQAERFLWFEFSPIYKFTDRFSISSTTYSGSGFGDGTVDHINFISLTANITKVPLFDQIYFNFSPQVFYLNIDGPTRGIFVSGVFALGYFGVPFTLSTQMNETLTTNLSPDPGFKWNVSVSYDF